MAVCLYLNSVKFQRYLPELSTYIMFLLCCALCYYSFYVFIYLCIKPGSRDGAVVIALISHQCGPGSIPGPGVISGLSLLLVLVLAPRVLLRVLRFSSLHKNQHFNSNSIGNSRATFVSRLTVMCNPRKTKLIIIIIIIIIFFFTAM